VSRVPSANFHEMPLNALLADLPRLAPLAMRHDEAVQALLPGARALIPLAFGSIYLSQWGIVDVLRVRANEWRAMLERLRDAQEWGLKIFTDATVLRQAAEQTGDDLRRRAAEAAPASLGRTYLLRKQHEQLVATEARRLAGHALEDTVARLTAVSVAVQRDELPAGGPGPVQLAIKAAFLVRTDAVEAFRTVAAGLAATYTPWGIRVEVSGPWAAYSFVGESR
jgi:hypothetical protein